MRPRPTHALRLPVLAIALAMLGAAAAHAAEPAILFPAKVTTMQGRIFQFATPGHEREGGWFVFYDGETEGRVTWRALDRVTFVGNLGHSPGAGGPTMARTRRVTLTYLDGTER